MSVGVERVDDVLLQAVNNTILKFGIPVVTAAGNAGSDACQNSPARSVLTISVGSTDQYDNLTAFSNFGRCVDGYVPGYRIKGAAIGRYDQYTVMSGTSMSAPIVTGMCGMLLQDNPKATWSDLRDYFNVAYVRNNKTLAKIMQAPPLTRVLAEKFNTTNLCSLLVDKPGQVQVQVSKAPGDFSTPSQNIQVSNPGKVTVSLANVPAPAPARAQLP